MKTNKVDELILAKCINNKGYEEILEIGKCYAVEEIQIGQSASTVIIDSYAFNSIKFKYYDDKLEEFDIYHSIYSPYHKIIEEDKKISKITKEEFERLDKRTLLELIIKNQNEIIDVVNKLNKK